MNKRSNGARWRAVATAALLFVAGGAMGILVDRLWLSPPETHATPLTAEGMAARLDLSSAEEAHLRALLDSLHTEILAAVRQDPDSVRTAVRHAQRRIEAALPPDVRPEFRAWIEAYHEQMMGHMHGRPMHPGMMHGEESMGPAQMSPPEGGAGRGVDTVAPDVDVR